MGRESSKESREFKPLNLLWTSSSSSSSSRFLFGETLSFSTSLSSGVPIDEELSGESPEKNTFPVGRFPANGGDEGTSMEKVGPTITSIKMRTKNNNKGIHEEHRHTERKRVRGTERVSRFFFYFERENEKW